MHETIKLRLSIPGKTLAVELPPDAAEVWFSTLAHALLDPPQETDEISDTPEDAPDEETEDDPEIPDGEPDAPDESRADPPALPARAAPEFQEPERYKGFLRIRCAHCGETYGYHAKTPIASHQCRRCGGRTPLHGLTKMSAHCTCGKHWIYQTNLDDPLAEISCIACGAPITMRQDKSGAYQTIGRDA